MSVKEGRGYNSKVFCKLTVKALVSRSETGWSGAESDTGWSGAESDTGCDFVTDPLLQG